MAPEIGDWEIVVNHLGGVEIYPAGTEFNGADAVYLLQDCSYSEVLASDTMQIAWDRACTLQEKLEKERRERY